MNPFKPFQREGKGEQKAFLQAIRKTPEVCNEAFLLLGEFE